MDTRDDDALDEVGQVRELVTELGAAMNASGDSVDSIGTKLIQVLAAYGLGESEVAVFPTIMLVETGHGRQAQVSLGSGVIPDLRFDQITSLYELVDDLAAGGVPAAAARERLGAITSRPPRFNAPLRALGEALIALAFALVLQPTPPGLLLCFALGLAVGLVRQVRIHLLEQVFPVVASFLVGVAVLELTRHLHIDNPIRVMIPPLVLFLPGGMLTTATVELSVGQMITGASRLVSGLVQLLLLAVGLVAASAVVHVPATVLRNDPTGRLGWWAPAVGVLVFALGSLLMFASPVRSVPWIIAVMIVALASQRLAAHLVGASLGSFFGAAVMAPVVLWFDSLPAAPPKMVLFPPGFWFLVPGAAGLIAVTQIFGAGHNSGTTAFDQTLLTIASIALGVLIGSSLYRVVGDDRLRAAPGRPETPNSP